MATITTNTSNGFYMILTVTQSSQSVANNTSTLSWSLKYYCGSKYYQNSSTTDAFKVVINGTTVYNTSKATWFSGSNTNVTVASGTTTVTHNSDGTKSVALSCSCTPGRTTSTASYYPAGSMTASGTMTLTTIPRASSISVSSGNGTKPGAGSIGLTITRASTAFSHTITWSCRSSSGTVGTGLTTSASWSVPISLITASPNANQTVTFTCTTYSGTTSVGTATCTATVGYYGASTMTSSGTTIGSAVSFAIARENSNFTHTLTYTFGSASGTVATKSTSTSLSFTPALSTFGAQIPNATSGTLTCKLTTYYSSTQIGSTRSYTYTLSMPSTAVPTVSAASVAEGNSTVTTLVGTYVQNKSTLSLSMEASGIYGSTISSYKITGCGKTINASSGTTDTITVSGSQTITYTVTDSRGRTSSTTKTITVLAYSNPKITGNGAERNTDTTAVVTATLECSSLLVGTIEKNALKYKIEYKSSTSAAYTTLTGEYDSLSQTLSRTITGLDESKSYEILIYVGDIFGYNSAYSPLSISTAFKAFDFDIKTGRLGIKKVLEHEDSVIEVPNGSKMYTGDDEILIDKILVFVEEV